MPYRKTVRLGRRLGVTTAVGLVLTGTVAAAQNAPVIPDQGAAPRTDAASAGPSTGRGQPNLPTRYGVTDVLVTAQKRTATVQKTAISIGVITGAELSATGKTTVDQALRDIPAVQVQRIAQGAQIFIRGVGSAIDPGFADPSVALMEDGVYDGRGESVQGGAFDIDRIEVLRGPQGTLYGRNATGGVVNVITAQPQLDTLDGRFQTQFGNYNLHRFEGDVNFGWDKYAVRIAGYKETRDAYVGGGGDDADNSGVRIKVRVKPVDWLSIVAKVETFSQDGDGENTVPVPGSAGQLPGFILGSLAHSGGVNVPQLVASGWVPSDPGDPWSNDPYHKAGYIHRRADVYQLQADADLGFGVLTLLPAYSRYENDVSSSLLFGVLDNYQVINDDTTYTSVEVRLASEASSPIKWVAGLYYLRTLGAGASGTTDLGQGYAAISNREPGTNKAVFGQATYPVTDRLRVTGGLRYGEDQTITQFAIVNTDPSAPGQLASSTYEAKINKLTYKAGIEYDVAPRSMLYASVSSGYKQGGLSTVVPPTPFKPEEITDYEIGIKNRFLDNRLQVNADAFYYRYDNYQVEVGSRNFIVPGVLLQTTDIVNAGPTDIYGGELEATWQVTAYDQLRGSATFLHARYGNATFPYDPLIDPVPGESNPIGGEQVADSPSFVGTIGYERTFDFSFGTIAAGVDSRFSTHYYANPEETIPGAKQGDYHRTDVDLRYTTPNKRYSISGWAKNLEDEAQTTSAVPAYRRVITPPFTIGVTAEAKF